MWRLDDLADAALDALRAHEGHLRAEQAVYGIDSLDEVSLHPILAEGFARAGFGVLREQPYPADRGKPVVDLSTGEVLEEGAAEEWERALEVGRYDRERKRCDLVLTPTPGVTLRDAVRRARKRKAAKRAKAETLFASVVEEPELDEEGAEGSIAPGDAFWLEVKLVAQHCYENGIPGPNRHYGSELVRAAVSDLAKLAKDRHIAWGGLLLVHFTADEATAEHDLVQMVHKCLDRGIAASMPITARFPVMDRIGNAVCSVSLLRAEA